MSVILITFSPTGGTVKAAEALVRGIGKPDVRIDLCDPSGEFEIAQFTADDIAVIAVPSYGGRVPEPALARIKVMKGNGAKAVLLCAYGNRAYDDTLVELRDVVTDAGFKVTAAVAAVTEHAIARQYAAGRPNADDEAELTSFGAKMLEKIRAEEGGVKEPTLPGQRPYRKPPAAGLVPHADKKHCIGCSICANNCPAGAINKDDPHKVDKHLCISCMRCVKICPHHARSLNGFVLNVVGWVLKKACSHPKANELFL